MKCLFWRGDGDTFSQNTIQVFESPLHPHSRRDNPKASEYENVVDTLASPVLSSVLVLGHKFKEREE